MRFSPTLFITLFLTLTLAAKSPSSHKSPSSKTPGTASKNPHKLALSKENPTEVAQHLKDYYLAADAELQQCTKARSLAHCLARGIDVKGKTTLSEEEGKKLMMEYHTKLGKELGDCTKKMGFEKCKTRIMGADDDKKLATRGKVGDFFKGFAQGFMGVFNAAGSIADTIGKIGGAVEKFA